MYGTEEMVKHQDTITWRIKSETPSQFTRPFLTLSLERGTVEGSFKGMAWQDLYIRKISDCHCWGYIRVRVEAGDF